MKGRGRTDEEGERHCSYRTAPPVVPTSHSTDHATQEVHPCAKWLVKKRFYVRTRALPRPTKGSLRFQAPKGTLPRATWRLETLEEHTRHSYANAQSPMGKHLPPRPQTTHRPKPASSFVNPLAFFPFLSNARGSAAPPELLTTYVYHLKSRARQLPDAASPIQVSPCVFPTSRPQWMDSRLPWSRRIWGATFLSPLGRTKRPCRSQSLGSPSTG